MNPVLSWIQAQKPDHVIYYRQAREIIVNIFPEVREYISYGIPFYEFKKTRICYLTPIQGTPILGLVRGAFIEDPFAVLQGNQKQVRHIDLIKHSNNEEAIKYFLLASI